MTRIALAGLVCTLILGLVHGAAAAPSISITHVPPYGSTTDTALQGKAAGVAFADYRVAAYLFVEGWWNKPTHASPTVTIASNGDWSVNVVTGGSDAIATKYIVFLLPKSASPPLASGQLQEPVVPQAVAVGRAARAPQVRTLDFSGYTWTVKRADLPVGPGPVRFSDRADHVWVAADGLHLTIQQRDGFWYATEVINTRSLGYGTYVVQVHGRVDQLDPLAILGLFTYDTTAPAEATPYRELDIVEHARWNRAIDDTNAQYVIQLCRDPWNSPRAKRFKVSLSETMQDLTHFMTWSEGKVVWKTYYGKWLDAAPPSDKLVSTWTFADASVPAPGKEQMRCNFWLLDGRAPQNGQRAEVVITGFKFVPPPPSAAGDTARQYK